jgi:molybdopterin synthase catalytic subunit
MSRLLAIRAEPLSIDECFQAVRRPDAGGIALFVGVVRDHDRDRGVRELEYSAHPDAERELARLADEIEEAFPVCALAAVHRVGRLDIGDLAVVVAVSCPHRDEAFGAARRLIDDLKATVPIWKRQVFSDGEIEWVGA